ncbi:GTP cyclohydrolase II [Nocardia arizonensis]|uniref:GTP cyclohydrolase II n=1 Tax=Nocardia arizonensis TaxID=1141647 RepID=UPI000AF708BB|nr:GTP cyclohydrolase II [Nocardia arizonensis]
MTTPSSNLAETEHRLTRKGRELRVRVGELPDGRDGGHMLIFGGIADDCLVRIHSRCLYGDALQSDDCDCGPELDLAMDRIQQEDSGVLIYLEQEGRGAGLIAKALGLRESERHDVDTFTSYDRLGFPRDSRSYANAAAGLTALGLRRVRLLTNNPAKARAVESEGIRVVVEPLLTRPRSARARAYLRTKREDGRHWLPTSSVTPWASELPSPETTLPMPILPIDASWSEESVDGSARGKSRSRRPRNARSGQRGGEDC